MSDSINKTINIDVNVENQKLDKAANGVEKITKATENHTDALNHNKKGILENGGAMGLLGAATGGLAMDFKDAVEAIELTGVSLKGLRGAIIATGIGALAIILLELVTNWDKWIKVIDGSTAATERLNQEIANTVLAQEQVDLAREASISKAKAYGVSAEELHRQEMAQFAEKYGAIEDLIKLQEDLIETEKNSWWSSTDAIKAAQDEIDKLQKDKRKNRTDANTAWQNEQFRQEQELVDNMIKSDDEMAAYEEKMRTKKLAAEKILNDKLLAFLKNRAQVNIKDLEALLSEFDKINDSVNNLNAGRYGEIYEKLKNVFDLYKSSQKNILDSEEKLKELQKEKRYAANAEQKELDKKIKTLGAELETKKNGFRDIVNPQLEQEIAAIREMANFEQYRYKSKTRIILESSGIINEQMKAETNGMKIINGELDDEEKKHMSIEETYKRKRRLLELNYDFEIEGLIKVERGLKKESEAIYGTLNAYNRMKKSVEEATASRLEDVEAAKKQGKGQEEINKMLSKPLTIDKKLFGEYQDELDKLFGFKVNIENITPEQGDKIVNEFFTLNDKFTSIQIEQSKVSTDIYQKQSDKTLEILKTQYDEEYDLDAARLQHKQDMRDAEMNLAENAAGLLGVFAEDSKDLMRASIIADSAIGIGKMVIANNLANIGALATPQAIATSGAAAAPIITMNNIATGLGIAANIAATVKALSKVGGGGADTGGAAAASGPQAKFNIVGSSSSNQLAATIAQQQQQPVKAYVVGTDMTTQQALDRNIQNSATFL